MSRASNELPKEVKKKKQLPVDENGRRIITRMTEKAWDILYLVVTERNLTQTEIAERLDSNQVYISRVVNSPCFQEELKAIKRQRIHDKLNDVLLDGAERMQEILNDSDSADANAIAAFKAVAGASGLNWHGSGGGVQVQVNNGMNAESMGVTPEMIEEANARKRKRFELEGEYVEVSSDE